MRVAPSALGIELAGDGGCHSAWRGAPASLATSPSQPRSKWPAFGRPVRQGEPSGVQMLAYLAADLAGAANDAVQDGHPRPAGISHAVVARNCAR